MDLPSLDEVRVAVQERYEVERPLSAGGMGSVYLGRNRELKSPVAIKVLPSALARTPEGLARFRREATLEAHLSHPHIVPVFDFQIRGDLVYLIMPLIEGETLAERLARTGTLPATEVRTLVHEIGGALGFAHERGVVHRDLKPSNILWEEASGRWMLTDFGVARATAADRREITQTGAVLGTPAYMAPEQALGSGAVDARSDLYALAAVAFEALVGERSDPVLERDTAIARLRAVRPRLATWWCRALAAPLAVEPDDRPNTAGDWLRRLEGRGWRQRPAPGVLGAAAAMVAAAALGWWWTRPPAAPATVPGVAVLPFAVQGELPGVDLSEGVTRAFEDQLRWIPAQRVVGGHRLASAVARRRSDGAPLPEGVAEIAAQEFGVTEILAGTAEVLPDHGVRVEVQVRDAGSGRIVRSARRSGHSDSLPDLVSALVIETFAERVALEQWGWSAVLPHGLEAVNAYLEGDRAFRRAGYAEATRLLETAIELDPSFAPAHFKRMLAEVLQAQPTRAPETLRSALEAAQRFKADLDPTTRQLLDGYTALLDDGHLEQAHETFQEIVARHPNAVDAWFVLGYLQFHFAPLLGIPRMSSQWAFERATALDPQFAAPWAQLARLAIVRGDEITARRYIGRYLAIDSTSVWAELARMGDSLLYTGVGPALAVRRSFPHRPTAVLEIMALTAGQLDLRRTERAIARDAIAVLWDRAASRTDRTVAFRLRMASELGAGRLESAIALIHEGRRRGVPEDELDRWIVLGDVTGVAPLAERDRLRRAASRLAAGATAAPAERNPVDLWLAARWARTRDARRSTAARLALEPLAEDSPLAAALAGDLAAHGLLAAGDTADAAGVWDQAMRRYSVEDVVFGLAGSLWPLRLARARLAASHGDHDLVIALTEAFTQMVGFVDQVAWREALTLRARAFDALGEGIGVRRTHAALRRILEDAEGPGALLRDSLARLDTRR